MICNIKARAIRTAVATVAFNAEVTSCWLNSAGSCMVPFLGGGELRPHDNRLAGLQLTRGTSGCNIVDDPSY